MLDGLGNRSQVLTTPPTPPSTVTYASDVVNQYTQVGGVTRTHDNNGNLTDDGTYLFQYDFENRLVEVKLKATQAVIATYRYDALGRRVEKAVSGGATTRYVLDGQEAVEEYDGQDVWQARYVYEDGIDRPRVMDQADQADVNGNQNTTEVLRFTYHQQALGSVTEISEPGGSVVEWVTYDVYGKPTILDQQGNVVTQSPVGNPYLFTGREFDAEDGLYFYRARAYDPVAGRFLQADPCHYRDSFNGYEYARSASASYQDPLGLSSGLAPVTRISYERTGDPKQDRENAREAIQDYSDEHPGEEPIPESAADPIGTQHPDGEEGSLIDALTWPEWEHTWSIESCNRPGYHKMHWRSRLLRLVILYPEGDDMLLDHEYGHVVDEERLAESMGMDVGEEYVQDGTSGEDASQLGAAGDANRADSRKEESREDQKRRHERVGTAGSDDEARERRRRDD